MKTIKDKIKQYPSMKFISDDGFQAIVHSDSFNYMGDKVKAIIIYKNDNGNGVYGKPCQVICGVAYDKVKNIFIKQKKRRD